MLDGLSLPDVLFVVNKQLPDGDYRVQYARRSTVCHVKLGMPGRTCCLPPSQFEKWDFEEGIRLADVALFWRLLRYLQTKRGTLALVHFHSTKLVLVGPLVARLAGIPSLATVTGLGRVFNDNRLRYCSLRWLYRLLLRLSSACTSEMLFQNSGDMEQVRGWLGKRARLRYVGSAVAGDVVMQKCFAKCPLVVLMVARLLPSKGISDFISIARALASEEIRFVLIGPYSAGADATYREVVAAHDDGIIQYRGELHGEDLQAAYEQAHVFLFTSYGEGLPRVMLEAGLAKCCPVAYGINANRDLVPLGGGFLVPLRDVTAATEAIRRLSVDRELLARAASVFQDKIASDYSFPAYKERLDEIIGSICASPHGTDSGPKSERKLPAGPARSEPQPKLAVLSPDE